MAGVHRLCYSSAHVLLIFILLLLQITSVVYLEFAHLDGSFLHFNISHRSTCAVSDSAGWSLNIIAILIIIPILNYLVFPCLREYTPNMLKRIGLGYIFALLAPLMLMVMETIAHHQGGGMANTCMFLDNEINGTNDKLKLSAWFVLFPHMSITLTEIFVFVSSMCTS